MSTDNPFSTREKSLFLSLLVVGLVLMVLSTQGAPDWFLVAGTFVVMITNGVMLWKSLARGRN